MNFSDSVHVPGTIDPRARLPVIFFIHGGGYEAGTTAGLSGADLIREAGGGIVAVESEYRLGIFGTWNVSSVYYFSLFSFLCRFLAGFRNQEKRRIECRSP